MTQEVLRLVDTMSLKVVTDQGTWVVIILKLVTAFMNQEVSTVIMEPGIMTPVLEVSTPVMS